MQYAIYLRKSRADRELEAAGEEDTLARHRRTLLDLAARQHLTVTQIYEEVVSGETLAARPEMQKLLAAVDQGCFAGVLVMEVERLARGDTIDQGIVAQSFKYSGTKIITPVKTYDPNNEFDEEYFEFGLFMSRREYKTINRRLQRGRVTSVNEGKWVSHSAPYGYRRVKLEHEKGWTLEPVEEQAQWVRKIFQWYTQPTEFPPGKVHKLGPYLIATRLNSLAVKTPQGASWTGTSVREMLTNPAYVGMVRWGFRASKKTVENGTIKTSRPRAEEYVLKRGLHPAIIDQATFDAAQERASHPSKPGPKQLQIKNPLAGLVVCGKCGHNMARRPYSNGRQAQLICQYPTCNNVSSDLEIVETAILEAMDQWLTTFRMERQTGPVSKLDTSDMEAALAALDKELSQMDAQEGRAYDLVEQGVYTSEIFLSRMRTLSERREKIGAQKAAIQEEMERLQQIEASSTALIPQMEHVLDAYPSATPQEKNDLLRSVLEKVEYTKTRRDRCKGGGDMAITLFPRIPRL